MSQINHYPLTESTDKAKAFAKMMDKRSNQQLVALDWNVVVFYRTHFEAETDAIIHKLYRCQYA